MSGNSLWTWFTSAGDNNVGGALFPEGQTRSSLNNGARQVQAEIRAFANDPGWVQYGDGNGPATITQASADSFTIAGVDATAAYHAGRRIKASGSSTGTIYGFIVSSSFSTNTTVVVDWDEAGALVSEAITVWLASQPEINGQAPSHVGSRPTLLRNGQFAFWGRGTSLTSLNDASLVADYCYLLSDGNDIADISKETSVKPIGAPAALKAEVETANKKFGFLFPIAAADAAMLIGGVASLSFKARASAGNATLATIRAAVISWSSTADAYTVDVVSSWNAADNNPTLATNWTYENSPSTITLNTSSWKSYRLQNIAIDTSSTANVAVFIWVNDTDATVDDLLYLADVKIEPGAVATSVPRKTVVRANPGVFWGGTSGGSANAQTLTVAGFGGYQVGQRFPFIPSASNTGAATLNVNGAGAGQIFKVGGATPLTAGDLVVGSLREVVCTAVTPTFCLIGITESSLPRGYLDGFQMSNDGSDAEHDIAIGTGAARANGDSADIRLASSLTKRFDAEWAVGSGNGGMQSGSSLANNTKYDVNAIMRLDTGVVDVMATPVGTTVTLPSGYDVRRRIGGFQTDGSANIRAFKQHGDLFEFSNKILSASLTDLGDDAQNITLDVPPNTTAIINVAASDNAALLIYLSPTDVSDEAPSATAAPLASFTVFNTGITNVLGPLQIRADASSQIRAVASADTVNAFRVATLGWIDTRGRQ